MAGWAMHYTHVSQASFLSCVPLWTRRFEVNILVTVLWVPQVLLHIWLHKFIYQYFICSELLLQCCKAVQQISFYTNEPKC
jgi:hypothetical protein